MTSAASDHDISVAEADTATYVDAPTSPWLELGVQIFMLILAIAILVNSLSLGLTVPLGPGAGFFPFFLSIGLGTLTAVWIVQSRRARAGSQRETAEPPTTEGDAGCVAADLVTERRHIVNIMVSLVALAVLMIPLGFQLPMFAFIVYHLWFCAHRRWYTVLVIALAGSVGVFHVFNDLLSVALPYSRLVVLNMVGM